jgi:hypothetical protein
VAAGEQVFARSPGASAGSRIIAAPFEFYTTGEDNLRITSFCSVANVALALDLRTIDNKGSINAHRHAHAPSSDRTAKSDDIVLGVGAVMNITTFATAGAPKFGQCFVIVQLIRGIGAAAVVLGTMLQGYVTQRQALGWPGSPIQSSFSGEPPVLQIASGPHALGTDWHIECPAGARWSIENIFTGLVTVGAATRIAITQISRGGVFTAFINPTQSQVGALSANYTWAPNLLYDQKITSTIQNCPLPAPCMLSAGDQIGGFTIGLTVFDQWNPAQLSYREWLEVAA